MRVNCAARAVSLTSHGSLANGSQAQYQARSRARPMSSGLSTPPGPRSPGMARKGRRRGRKRGLGWLSARIKLQAQQMSKALVQTKRPSI